MRYDPLDDSNVPADALGRVFTPTRYVEEAFRLFDDLMANPCTVNHGWGYAVLGPPRCGKTTVVKSYLRMRRDQVDGRRPLRYLWVQLSVGSNLASVALDTLEQLGDPNPDYGSQTRRTGRVVEAIVDGGYDLIVFDEAHHLIDSDTLTVQKKATAWFAQLLDQTKRPMLLVGYELFGGVLDVNEFLGGRMLPFPKAMPYRHDDEADMEEFSDILADLDAGMGLPALSGLNEPELAQRLCVVCLGRLGLLERFLTSARRLARERRHSCLTEEVLVETAAAVVGSWAGPNFNPFTVKNLDQALKKHAEPVEQPEPRRRRGRDRDRADD